MTNQFLFYGLQLHCFSEANHPQALVSQASVWKLKHHTLSKVLPQTIAQSNVLIAAQKA